MGDEALTPTAEELIDEIAGAFREHNEPPPNSFTLSDFMELTGDKSQTTAYRYLQRLVDKGELVKVLVKKANYYYRKGT